MTSSEALILARQELDRCRKRFRCKVLDDYRVEINRRMRSYAGCFGLCDVTKKCIRISAQHVERDSYSEVLDTIRHEIAHAITHWDEERKGLKHDNQYTRSHNDLFYRWCVKIGCKPQRCADSPRRPKHPDEKPKYSLGCKCICYHYRRLPADIRTDETGRAFRYGWIRHEYWDSRDAYMKYLMEVWVKNNPDAAARLKPSRVEWEIQRHYFGCEFDVYRHGPNEKGCGQPLYLYSYPDGCGMWYLGQVIRNYKIDDLPPKYSCSECSHYPGQDGAGPGNQ